MVVFSGRVRRVSVAVSVYRNHTFIALALAACASTGTPRPAVNVTLAATYSATLDAAQSAYARLAVDNHRDHEAGDLTDEQYQAVKDSLRKLGAALSAAHGELNVYLYSGVESEALRTAFTRLSTARTDTDLLWSAVHGDR